VSESQERHPGEVFEKASVRLNGVLKGETEYKPGELIAVTSRSDSTYSPNEIETPLNPGKQFLLLTVYRENKSSPLELDRCLVLSDTPEIRDQLKAGVAQNDSLTRALLTSFPISDSCFLQQSSQKTGRAQTTR
jgi:hypothetical protein